MLLHCSLGKLKIQILCRYSADMEENANKLHFECTGRLPIVRWSDQEHLFVLKEYKVSGRLREVLKQKLSALQALLKHFTRKSLQIIRNTDDWWIPVSRNIWWTVLWVCSLSSWLKINSLTVSTFSPVPALLSLLLIGRLSTVPVSRNFFNSLLTPRFVQLFSGNLSIKSTSLLCTPSNANFFYQILSLSLNTMLIVDKHCSDVSVMLRISGATNLSQT